jgi:hypothetical protein
MKRLITVLSLVCLAFAGGATLAEPAASAHGRPGWRPPAHVATPLVSVSLESPHGGALRSVEHRGQTFVAGESGERYAIRVHNNSADRIEVVVSVDGRDAVSGKLGDFRSQRGYVVQPFGSVVIDGFRTSLEDVAAFRFSSVGSSFAGRLGTPDNAGVIGVAVFRERGRQVARRSHPRRPVTPTDDFVPFDADGRSRGPAGGSAAAPPAKAESQAKRSADAAPSTTSRSGRSGRSGGWSPPPEPSRELGTAFGEHRFSAAREVSFTRANERRPDFLTQIQYDTTRGLAARGVPIEPEPVFASPPPGGNDPWPGATTPGRFTEPPPRWR